MLVRRAIAGGVLVLFAGCAAADDPAPSEPADATTADALTTVLLRPTTGIAATATASNVCAGAMWSCVDDAASAGSCGSDGDTTYVASTAGASLASHVVGYSGAPAGTVSSVTVHVVAARTATATGSVHVELYDGATRVAQGPEHPLATTYACFSDTLTPASAVTDANQLRTSTVFTNTAGAGSLKYSAIALDVSLGAAPPPPPPSPPPSPSGGVIMAGAGDISCDYGERIGTATEPKLPCQDVATANALVATRPSLVFTLGDNQYMNGQLANYRKYYDASWGRLLGITRPTVGNHEYNGSASCSSCAGGCSTVCAATNYMEADYYTYFGAAKSTLDPGGKGFYSYDVATSDPTRPWHVVVLNAPICDPSEFPAWADVKLCEKGSPQVAWLEADLAAFARKYPAAKCTMGMWHEPRFSSGSHGNNPQYGDFWSTLYAAHAELVMNGHDHDYEHFAAQDPSGVPTPHGIEQMVVGSGGRDYGGCKSSLVENSLGCHDHTFGVMKLTLHPDRLDYAYVDAAATVPTTPVNDQGSILCHD